jgi:hypothetical protein
MKYLIAFLLAATASQPLYAESLPQTFEGDVSAIVIKDDSGNYTKISTTSKEAADTNRVYKGSIIGQFKARGIGLAGHLHAKIQGEWAEVWAVDDTGEILFREFIKTDNVVGFTVGSKK